MKLKLFTIICLIKMKLKICLRDLEKSLGNFYNNKVPSLTVDLGLIICWFEIDKIRLLIFQLKIILRQD